MSHAIQYLDYHCSVSEHAILKDLNSFAYDPQETSGYHGNLKFHHEPYTKIEKKLKKLFKSSIKAGMMTMPCVTDKDAKFIGQLSANGTAKYMNLKK